MKDSRILIKLQEGLHEIVHRSAPHPRHLQLYESVRAVSVHVGPPAHPSTLSGSSLSVHLVAFRQVVDLGVETQLPGRPR